MSPPEDLYRYSLLPEILYRYKVSPEEFSPVESLHYRFSHVIIDLPPPLQTLSPHDSLPFRALLAWPNRMLHVVITDFLPSLQSLLFQLMLHYQQ